MIDRKTALVTGANKGIGREIARRLGAQGYSVWLACRDGRRGEAAAAALRPAGQDAHSLLLDVADGASVRTAADTLGKEIGALDVLVNNAGVSLSGRARPGEEDIEKIRATYEVNVFGAIRVTQAFLPLLRKSPAGRIVMMSRGLGSIAAALDPASEFHAVNILGYNSSKTALNAVTVAFAKDLAGAGIKVNAADPGYTATDLNRNSGHRTVEQAAEIAVQLATLPDDGPTGGFFNDEGGVPW